MDGLWIRKFIDFYFIGTVYFYLLFIQDTKIKLLYQLIDQFGVKLAYMYSGICLKAFTIL